MPSRLRNQLFIALLNTDADAFVAGSFTIPDPSSPMLAAVAGEVAGTLLEENAVERHFVVAAEPSVMGKPASGWEMRQVSQSRIIGTMFAQVDPAQRLIEVAGYVAKSSSTAGFGRTISFKQFIAVPSVTKVDRQLVVAWSSPFVPGNAF